MTENATAIKNPASRKNPLDLLSAPILPTLTRLSLPNAIAMLAAALVAIAETRYAGIFGTAALAGLALVFPMVMLQQMMSAGAMGGGVSSSISRALGADDTDRASALAYHALLIGGLIGGTFCALFLLFGEQIFGALGGRGEALSQAMAYSNTVAVGMIAIWFTNMLASVIRGGGDMKTPSIILLLVAIGQLVLGGLFGLGLGPVPRLGMAGVALGVVVAFGAGSLFLLWYLMSGRARVRLHLTGNRLQMDMFWDILKVGAIACISPLQTILTVALLTRYVASFGVEALAGYGIGSRLEFLLIPITFAIGVACIPMVGMAIGAGHVSRARQVAWTGSLMAACILGSVGLFVAVFPDMWTGLFTDDLAVLASARLYFAWVGPFYALFGVGLCLFFASQGAGKVFGPVIAGTIRLAMIGVGGWFLTSGGATESNIFALVGLAMAVYGLATAWSVYRTRW